MRVKFSNYGRVLQTASYLYDWMGRPFNKVNKLFVGSKIRKNKGIRRKTALSWHNCGL